MRVYRTNGLLVYTLFCPKLAIWPCGPGMVLNIFCTGSYITLLYTHLWRMHFPVPIIWTSPFLGASGGEFFHSYFIFRWKSYKQKEEPQIGRQILRLRIWGYSVCLCFIKKTPNLYVLNWPHNVNRVFSEWNTVKASSEFFQVPTPRSMQEKESNMNLRNLIDKSVPLFSVWHSRAL